MKQITTMLLLLVGGVPFSHGQWGFAPKHEMIAKSDVIALVEITQVTSNPAHNRQGDQDAAATVLQVLKGDIREIAVIGFEIPRSRSGESIRVSEEACAVLHTSPALVMAGDAFAGPKVEGAAHSGWAAAEILLDHL